MATASIADNLPIIFVNLKELKSKEKVYALSDTEASFSMIESDVASRLGLQGKKKTTNSIYYD